MVKRFELFTHLAALLAREAYAVEENSWTDDLTVCNMYRLVD